MSTPTFTGVQLKMASLLADGLPHTRQELHNCLYDELGSILTVRVHLCNIRKKLRLVGEDILCEYIKGKMHYRRIRLLPSATDGKR